MKDNYDFSKGIKNPYADKLKQGYSVTIHYDFSGDNELDGMIQLTPIKESANKSKTKVGALSASSFMALRIDTRGFKFDREEANERR